MSIVNIYTIWWKTCYLLTLRKQIKTNKLFISHVLLKLSSLDDFGWHHWFSILSSSFRFSCWCTVHWFTLISTDFHRFFRWFPLIQAESLLFPLIPADFRWFPLIPADSHGFPRIPADSRWFPLIPVVSSCFRKFSCSKNQRSFEALLGRLLRRPTCGQTNPNWYSKLKIFKSYIF